MGWAIFALTVLLLAGLYLGAAREFLGSLTWVWLIAGHLIVAVVVMVGSVILYSGRTDFTR